MPMSQGNDLSLSINANLDMSPAQKTYREFLSSTKRQKLELPLDIKLDNILPKLDKQLNNMLNGSTRGMGERFDRINTKVQSFKVKFEETIDEIDKKTGETVKKTVDKFKEFTKVTETFKNDIGDVKERVSIWGENNQYLAQSVQTVQNGITNITTETKKYSEVLKEQGNSTNEVVAKVTQVQKTITDTAGTEKIIVETTKEWIDANNQLHKSIEVTDEKGNQLKPIIENISKGYTETSKSIKKYVEESGAVVTVIEEMTKAGDHLKTVISEEVDAEGKIVKTTQVWDAANRKLLSSHKEIIDDQEKLAKEQQKLQESLVQTSKTVNILKNSAGQIITTTEEIAKNGDRVYTVITETENGLGRLTKETEKYVLTKNQQGEVEKKILENSKESINNQLQEIEKLEQLNQYKKELTTTTRESEEAVRREGQVYRAVVKTIQEETHEYGTLTTTITTYKDALGNTVVETRKVNEAGEEVAQTTRTVTNELNKAADGNQKLGSSANQAAKETKTLGESLSDCLGRLVKYYVASLPIQAVRKAITETIQTVKDFDNALVEFRKVSDLAGDSLTKYVAKLAEMGELTGSTMQAMVEAATEFKKSSFDESDSAKLASVAEMYRNIADEEISAAESASFLISQMKAFNINASEAEHIIDAVNETSNNFAVSSADIATNLSKMSAVMAVNNVSFEEQIGMLIGVTEITRNASSATRGLTMIASRLTQVLDDSSSTGKKLSAIYEKLGISLKDENGQLRSTYDILKDLSERWDTLSENEQKYISLTSAGARQQNVFTSLMKNFNTVVDATSTAYNSAGSAAKENAKVMDTISKKAEILRSEFQQIVIGKGGLTDLAKGFLDIAIAALKFVDAIGGLTPLLVTLAGVLITIKADAIVDGFLKFDKICLNLIPNLQSLIASFIQTTLETGSLSAGLETLGLSAHAAQIALGALTAVISIAVIAYKKYQQQQEENHRKALEAIDDYKNYTDSLSNTLKKIEEENVSKKELIEINKKLNDSYDDEKAQLKDISDLREENIKLLYKENQEKAKATERELGAEKDKSQKYLDSKVKSTDLGGAKIKRNTLLDTMAYEYTMSSTVGKSRKEQLEIIEAEIDKYNEKIRNNTELTKSESLTLQQLTSTYDILKQKYDDATNIVNTYNEAEKTLTQTEEEFVNTLRAKAEEQNSTTELTKEEQQELIEQYHLTEEAIQQVMDAQEGMTRSEAIQYLVDQADAAGELSSEIENLAQSLGITATELEGLRNRFDDLTLGSFLSQLADARQKISDISSVIDNLQDALTNASTALEEYNQNGYLTLDTFQGLMGISAQYLAALVNENGQLEINQTTLGNLVEQLKVAKIQELQEAAAMEIAANHTVDASTASANAVGSVASIGNTIAETGNKAATAAGQVATFASSVASLSGVSIGDMTAKDRQILNNYKNIAKEIANITVNTTKAGNAATAAGSKAKSAGRAGASAAKQANDATKELNKTLEDTKSQYERVISWVTKQYDKKIDSINKAKDAALDAIDEEINALEKQKDKALKYFEEKIKITEKDKEAVEKYWNARIDALKKQNKEQKEALELQEKLDALEKARNTKVKIYKEGQGFVYDVDQTKVAEAQKELNEYLSEQAYEKELERLEALKDAEVSHYEKRLELLNEFKDKASEHYEQHIEALKEHRDEVEKQYDDEIELYENYKQQFEDMVNSYQDQQDALLAAQLLGIDIENDNWMTRLDNLQNFVNQYNSLLSQLDSGAGGATTDTSGGGGDTGSSTDSGTRTVTNQDTPDNQYSPTQNSKSTISNSTGKTGYVPTSVTDALGTNSSGRVKSHASGVGSVKNDEIAIVGENPNQEIVIGSKLNNGELMSLDKGTGVVNADSSSTLAGMLNQVGKFGASGFGSGNGTLNNNINNDSLVVNGVTIQGANINDPQTFVNGLLNLKAEAIQRAYKHR